MKFSSGACPRRGLAPAILTGACPRRGLAPATPQVPVPAGKLAPANSSGACPRRKTGTRHSSGACPRRKTGTHQFLRCLSPQENWHPPIPSGACPPQENWHPPPQCLSPPGQGTPPYAMYASLAPTVSVPYGDRHPALPRRAPRYYPMVRKNRQCAGVCNDLPPHRRPCSELARIGRLHDIEAGVRFP